MVTFIPPYFGQEIKSNAEKKVFRILKDLDLPDCYVLHSLGLPRHDHKKYGEVDFVVVCQYGVACLEIKGGRVECKDGKWFLINRYGKRMRKAEGPIAQVVGNMFNLEHVLMETREIRKIMPLTACGVMFPDIKFTSESEEIIPEIIFDKNIKNITDYIIGLFNYWKQRRKTEYKMLNSDQVKKIVQYLRKDFTFIPTLKDRLDEVDQRLIRLTSEQSIVLNALSLNERLLIEGKAGTGKTLLAVHHAKELADQQLSVLYLTFNKNLANSLYEYKNDYLDIINIHALYGNYIEVDANKVKDHPRIYFNEELPQLFYDYIQDHDMKTYDVLIIDEAQDILNQYHLKVLDCLLKDGLENGKWAIFYDKDQNIYNPYFDEGMKLLFEYQFTHFKLFVNCRNTIQIGRYGEKESGIQFHEYLNEEGEEVQEIVYKHKEDFKNKITCLLNKLKKEKISMKDITFLAPKKYEGYLLDEANIKVNIVSEDTDYSLDLPLYGTLQGYKGLDSKIVILIGVEDILDVNYSKFMYIASTRARTMLFVVRKKGVHNK